MNRNKSPLHFFLCPASDYLNQFNETGSHGQISYQFMKHLAAKKEVENIFAATIMSLDVAPLEKTKLVPLLPKKPALTPFDSLYFYLFSFIRFISSKEFKKADVIHHIIPFSYGRSFNLFFLLKNKKKKYCIGPIIGPHTNTEVTADEVYVFKEKESWLRKTINFLNGSVIKASVFIFGSVLGYLSKKTMQNADIVFFSDNHARNYHKKFLKPSQKAIILDTGIDTNVFKPAVKRKIKKEDEALNVLFVGRLTKRKGCEYLIHAIAKAKEKRKGIKIHCGIHGIGPLEKELKILAKTLKVEKEITFLGGVSSNEEIVERYYKYDIVCLPALSETFTVTKEAMACGKPVIVTDVCSNAERVKPGINGFVVPPKDANAIATILVKIAGDKKKLVTLSNNAVKVRPLYDWDNIITTYLTYLS